MKMLYLTKLEQELSMLIRVIKKNNSAEKHIPNLIRAGKHKQSNIDNKRYISPKYSPKKT